MGDKISFTTETRSRLPIEAKYKPDAGQVKWPKHIAEN